MMYIFCRLLVLPVYNRIQKKEIIQLNELLFRSNETHWQDFDFSQIFEQRLITSAPVQRRNSVLLLKYPGKVTGVIIAATQGYGSNTAVRLLQQFFSLV